MATIEQLSVKALKAGEKQIWDENSKKPKELEEGLLDYAMKSVQTGLTVYEGLEAGQEWWSKHGQQLKDDWGVFKDNAKSWIQARKDTVGDPNWELEGGFFSKDSFPVLSDEGMNIDIEDDYEDEIASVDYSKNYSEEEMRAYENRRATDPNFKTSFRTEGEEAMIEAIHGERPHGAFYDSETGGFVNSAGESLPVNEEGNPMTFPVVEPPGYVTGEAWRGEYYETRQYPSGPEEKLEWEQRAAELGITYQEYQGDPEGREIAFNLNVPYGEHLSKSVIQGAQGLNINQGEGFMSNPAFEAANPESTAVLEDSRVSQYLNGTTNFNVNIDGDYVSTTMMNETASFVLDDDSMAGVDYKGNKSYGTK